MWIVYLVDVIAAGGLAMIALTKGLEAALPFATYMIVLLPPDAMIPLGMFDLNPQRVIVVILTLFYFVSGGNRTGIADKTGIPLKILMVVHVGWCIVSTADSIVLVMSIKRILGVVFEYYILYIIYLKTVTRIETIHRILAAMVFGVITSSIFGPLEAYGGWTVMSLFPTVMHRFGEISFLSPDRGVRIHSTFLGAISFGTALAMAITLALYLLDILRKPMQRRFLWFGLMLMFLNLYKTASRGPWLDAIIGCVLLFVLGHNGHNHIRKRVMAIGMLSIAVCIFRPGVWDSIAALSMNTFDSNNLQGASFDYRFALRDVAIKAVLQSPGRALWGYGMESFFYLNLTGQFRGKLFKFMSCDSSWIAFMVETGFVGLLIIALLLFKPARVAWRHFRQSSATIRNLPLVLLINLVVFYVQMLSVNSYPMTPNGHMLWIIIALIYIYGNTAVRLKLEQNQLVGISD